MLVSASFTLSKSSQSLEYHFSNLFFELVKNWPGGNNSIFSHCPSRAFNSDET